MLLGMCVKLKDACRSEHGVSHAYGFQILRPGKRGRHRRLQSCHRIEKPANSHVTIMRSRKQCIISLSSVLRSSRLDVVANV
ncbi:hypothetical protein M3J09_012294 [Ascochyta lentis]